MNLYHTIVGLPLYPNSIFISQSALHFDHVMLHGHRYCAARLSGTVCDSLVLVHTAGAGLTWVGEMRDIVCYETSHIPCRIFAYIRWF